MAAQKRRWLRLLLITIGLVILLLALFTGGVYVWGLMLDEDFKTDPITYTIDESPEKVWQAIIDYKSLPMAGSQIVEPPKSLPDENGKPVWIENMGESQITVKTIEWAKSEKIVRSMADNVVPMTAKSTVTLKHHGDGCLIQEVREYTVKSGTWHTPFFRVILRCGGATGGIHDFWTRAAKKLGGALKPFEDNAGN